MWWGDYLVNKVEQLALIRWETCGPNIARLISEFDMIDIVILDISSDVLEFVKIAFITELYFHLILKLTARICKYDEYKQSP